MKKTFSRTFFTAATILLVALLILGASFQVLIRRYFEDNAYSNLSRDAQLLSNLATAYSVDGSLVNWNFLVNLDVAAQVSDSDTVICDQDGFVILCSDALKKGCKHQGMQVNPEYLEKVYKNEEDQAAGLIQGLFDEDRYIVSRVIQSPFGSRPAGIVIVSVPVESSTLVMNKIFNMFLTATIFVVLIAVLAISLFSRNQSRPLRDMSKAANAFGHGDLDARVPLSESYSEEVEELAIAFNNMASLLQKSEYQRQEFVANVSHELKTPMTTISGYVDGILDGTIPDGKKRHYLQIVSDETKRLSRLVRSMLDISRLQDQEGIPEDQKLHFDMEECAGQVLITFEQKINAKNLDVDVDMPAHPVCTFAHRDHITQVIYNLLDNAVKFCPQKGTIGLKIRESNGKIYTSIANDGETIPADELPLVFDRFHKLDKSRSQNRDGWGLGLYIVKTIVCSHGENISVTSREGRTEFTFTMPLVN